MKFKRNLMFIVAFAAFVSSAFSISTTVNADSQNNGVEGKVKFPTCAF